MGVRQISLAIPISFLGAFPGFAESDCQLANTIKMLISNNLVAAVDEVHCQTYLSQSGSEGASCAWTFPYRAKEAVEFYDRARREIARCHLKAPASASDLRVNHPDSYDLEEFVGEDGTMSVSLKDKGALGNSFVFIRFEPLNPGAAPTQ